MRHIEEQEESSEKMKITSSIGSMLFSIILVAIALGFVFGFKYYLSRKTYTGPGISEYIESDETGEDKPDEITLEKDKGFHNTYIMIQGLEGKELWTTKIPGGEKDSSSKSLQEGDILEVKQRGTLNRKFFYQLKDGRYVAASKSIIPLKEYVKLEGYLSITYISSSGVRLRKWADFDADNIVDSVYVGDKVTVNAKVVTVNDVEAYRTEEGYYITTDSRYLNEHTTVVEDGTVAGKDKNTAAAEDSASEKSTTSE